MPHTILIVEDYAPVRRLLHEWLESAFPGTEVTEASSGEEGVSAVQARPPEVILMDIGLPGMNGIEAAGRIAALAPQARVVMLSALDGDRLRQKAAAAGASAYVSKGSAHRELLPVLEKLLSSGTPLGRGVET